MKYFILIYLIFFQFAIILNAINLETLIFFPMLLDIEYSVIEQYIFALVVCYIVFFLGPILFILTIWSFSSDYRADHSVKEVFKSFYNYKAAKKVFDIHLFDAFKYLYDVVQHQVLVVAIFVIIGLSPDLPFFGKYKAYSSEDIKAEEFFEDSYNYESFKYLVVIDRVHSRNMRELFDPEDEYGNKYFFMKESAMIRGYHYLDRSETPFHLIGIFSLEDWFITFIYSIVDSIFRAFYYGMIPYIIGVIYFNFDDILTIIKRYNC